jgi:hypothetical protein
LRRPAGDHEAWPPSDAPRAADSTSPFIPRGTIERCKGKKCTNFAAIADTGANVATYEDIGLSSNTAYRYRVRSFSDGGNSTYSNLAAAKTPRK